MKGGAMHLELKLTPKKIKEMCGAVSFKTGEAIYRADKVSFLTYSPSIYEAVIKGKSDTRVKVELDKIGRVHTSCSCPKLASYNKDCQHIAAVLLAVYHKEPKSASDLTDGLLSIFEEQPYRSSRQQRYFENRELVNITFNLKPIGESHSFLFGMQLQIGDNSVVNVRDFLENIHNGRKSTLSLSFIFDPHIHCFKREAEEIIQQLIQIQIDEEFFRRESSRSEIILISPSAWNKLLPLLTNLPEVRLEYGGNVITGLQISSQRPSLQFNLEGAEGDNLQLNIKGIRDLLVLPMYACIVDKGVIIHLDEVDCKRLINLQEMLQTSKSNHIPIQKEQVPFFMDKILPGLRKIGNVNIAESISERVRKVPLVAKLYLDRVKNRLLASLEFHYGDLLLNPLENNYLVESALLVREKGKEQAILQIMEDSQFATTDEGYFMQNEELEFEFLYNALPRLQELTQVYATTAVRNRIFKGTAHPKIKVKVKKERTNWLEFKFEMTGIPEQEIRDLLQALEEKRKYYRLKSGSLLSLEAKEFAEIERFLQEVPIQNYETIVNGLDLPMSKGIAFLDKIVDNPLFTPEESFHQFIKDISDPQSLQFKIPESLKSILRDYQVHGYYWLKTLAAYGFGGILADDMGLGKTLQSIAYTQSVVTEVKEKKLPVLIVCPTSVTYNWLSEFMKFTPQIEALVVDGNKNERRKTQQKVADAEVIITSYNLLRKDIEWFRQQSFHTVFFDEAQAFKNPLTQTFRAVKQLEAKHRFALTGTPVENSIEELWAIFHVIFPDLFQGLNHYANLTKKQIARRSRPFLLRRMKEDVLEELPEKIEIQESVELLPEQTKLYAAYLAKLRTDTLKHLDKDTIRKNRIKILAGITRLRQICCHPGLFVDRYKGGSAKFNKLLEIVEESKASRRRVLIFSQFTKMLELIGRQLTLRDTPYFYLDGQTGSEERVEICDRFNNGENNFFLISLKAGGTGLNLTGADTVILYDIWWNPAVEEQATDRAHRIGQERTVKVIKLVTRGTIEEKMDQLQEKKRQLIEEIIDSKESMNLTEDDIRELLMVEPVGMSH